MTRNIPVSSGRRTRFGVEPNPSSLDGECSTGERLTRPYVFSNYDEVPPWGYGGYGPHGYGGYYGGYDYDRGAAIGLGVFGFALGAIAGAAAAQLRQPYYVPQAAAPYDS
jgi:hypothetical protein